MCSSSKWIMRFYLDTSVYSAYDCITNGEDTRRLFELMARYRKLEVVVSDILWDELGIAGVRRRGVLKKIPLHKRVSVFADPITYYLASEYIKRGALTKKSGGGCLASREYW